MTYQTSPRLRGFAQSAGILFLLAWNPNTALAASEAIGSLANVIGKAAISRDGKSVPATKGMPVYATDVLVTEDKTAVKIAFKDGSTFMAFEKANVSIEEYKIQTKGAAVSLKSAFNIAKGKVRFFVKPKTDGGSNDSQFKTANAVMGIRGTSGFIDASQPGKTQLVVLTGKVEVSNPSNPGKFVTVPANQMTDVVGSSLPTPPKAAPAALIKSLGSDASSAGPASDDSVGEKKDDEKKDDAKKDEPKKDDEKKDDAKKDEPKKDEPKKDEPKKDEPKKDEPKKDEPKKDEPKKDEPKKPTEAKKDEPKSTEPKPSTASSESKPSIEEKPAPRTVLGGSSSESSASPKNKAGGESVRMERNTVFSPDGSTTVSVSDKKLQAVSLPTNIDAVKTSTNTAATKQMQQQINTVIQTQNAVNEQVKATVDVIQPAKAAEKPTKRNVKIIVTLPQAP